MKNEIEFATLSQRLNKSMYDSYEEVCNVMGSVVNGAEISIRNNNVGIMYHTNSVLMTYLMNLKDLKSLTVC